jgi:Asp-tRNA(Asn)/Glu-tRNA(Gln) amidotransferase A subunit family amidase
MRQSMAGIAAFGDALLTLSSVGVAPQMDFLADSGEPEFAYKTGDPAFNAATSALGVPAITVPKMAVGKMPLGVQLIGPAHGDWRLANIAKWLDREIGTIAV